MRDFTEGTITLDMKEDFVDLMSRVYYDEDSRRWANSFQQVALPVPGGAVDYIYSTNQMNQPVGQRLFTRGRTHHSPTVLLFRL